MNASEITSETLLSAATSAFRFYLNENSDILLLSNCKAMKPILQNGPECGIVALSMATQLVSPNPVSSSTILRVAREMGFTLQGEMFSADNMAALAECVCPCKAVSITNLGDCKREIIAHLLMEYPALVPYDSFHNHEPCNFNGHKAHWSTIVGIGLAVRKTEFTGRNSADNVYFCENSYLSEFVDKASAIFVCALQGKSKRMGIWNLNELLESNGNLKELASRHDPAKMILPQNGDVLSGLRDKAVLLMPKFNEILFLEIVPENMNIQVTDIGIRFNPPAILLFYEDALGTLHKRTMPVRGLRKNSIVNQVSREFREHHGKYLQDVPSYKIEKMIRLLQENMRGKSLDEALNSVQKDYEIDSEEDLNALDNEMLQRKKEIMDEIFEKNRKKVGDPDFQYNIEVDFMQGDKEKSVWDSDDEKDS